MVWVDDGGAPIAELSVSYEGADLLSLSWKPTETAEGIDVNGATAIVVADQSGRVAIAWSTGAVDVQFTTRLDRATAESIARSLHEVGEHQWNAAAGPQDPDICLSLYC